MIKILNVPSLYSALYKTVEICKRCNDKEINVIVPDKLGLFMERFLLEKTNSTASFNVKVATLNRFAKKSCVVDSDKIISDNGSVLLVHKILNENMDKFKVLKNKSYSFSYAEDIFKTIYQLKASKISFDEMKNFSSKDARLADKISDLSIVYECYENEKAGLLDASDLFLMTSLSIANNNVGAKILFVGFDDFTAIEYAIIEQLSNVAEVMVMNYFSKGENKHIYNNEVFYQLKNIAHINQTAFEIEDCEVKKSNLKQFIENNMFAIKEGKFTLDDEIVKIYSANNVEEEIEFVARDIRSKILNGARYDDFGVALFNFDANINKTKEIFDKYEINYYLDTKLVLNKSILFKFFASVMKYNLDGYNLSNLLDIVNSPFFDIDNQSKRLITQIFLSIGFRGKVTKQTNLSVDEEIKEKLVNFFDMLIFDKEDNAKAIINKFKIIDEHINFDKILQNIETSSLSDQILLTKSKETIFKLFEDMVRFDNCEDLKSFYDVFTRVASVIKISNLPLSLDAVKVVDANNSMEIFNELYIVNATHENAPNFKYDCGIILDGEIEKLNFAHKLSPTIAHINRLAKLRLYNSVISFENELTLTYSSTQSDAIQSLLNCLQVETAEGLIDLQPISKLNFGKYAALTKWDYIESLACFDKNNLILDENVCKNKDFSQISVKNLKIFNDFNNVSATALENYFKCPFYAFLNNTLKIKPKMDNEILSLDIGNILHQIMFEYYKRNKQVGEIYDFCKDEVFKCVEREDRLKLNLDSPILTNLIDEAVRVINAVDYIDKNSLFEPKYFELDFRGETALKLKNISVVGKVDRIDVFNDMFRIVDYKSGKADANLKELYYGNKLQLFLYSCAMENILNKCGVGAFYLPLHNAYTKEVVNTYALKGFYLAEDFVVRAFDKRLEAGVKSDIVNVKLNKSNGVTKTIGYKELEMTELNSLKNYSKMVSEKAVEEIKSGFVLPTPSEVSKPCEFCPYVHICMRDCNNIAYRKACKINLDSFKEAENEGI